MSISIKVRPDYGPPPPGWDRGTQNYRVTLRRGKKSITTEYHQGSGIAYEPRAEDVLESLALDARCGDQSYEDYLSDFGSEDNKESRRVYRACARMTPKLKAFLGDDYEAVLQDPEESIHRIVHAKPRSTR
ncbi:MAG: hypothetical protein ACYDH4_09910 [Candidatus Cryosericum sp.]